MTTSVNPRYPSYALRWSHEITSENKDINFAIPGSSTTQFMTLGTRMFAAQGSFLQLESSLQEELESAYTALVGNEAGTFEVTINSRNRLEITSGKTTDIDIAWDDAQTTTDPALWGFQNATVTVPAGGTLESDHQVGNGWTPRMFDVRDSGDFPVYKVGGSEDARIPHYVEYSDPWVERHLKWVYVPGARIRVNRTAIATFAAVADEFAGCPNAAIENLLEHAYGNGDVYFHDELSSTPNESGPYRVLAVKSELLEGVKDEALNDDSALEAFDVEIWLRDVS